MSGLHSQNNNDTLPPGQCSSITSTAWPKRKEKHQFMTYCDEATGLTKEKSMACVLRLSMDESTGPTNKKSMACMDESTGPKKKRKKSMVCSPWMN